MLRNNTAAVSRLNSFLWRSAYIPLPLRLPRLPITCLALRTVCCYSSAYHTNKDKNKKEGKYLYVCSSSIYSWSYSRFPYFQCFGMCSVSLVLIRFVSPLLGRWWWRTKERTLELNECPIHVNLFIFILPFENENLTSSIIGIKLKTH